MYQSIQHTRQLVEEILSPLMRKNSEIQCSVGLVTQQTTWRFHLTHGNIICHSEGEHVALFEIGSITKTFTGVLLASTIQQGDVALHQPICTMAPYLNQFPPEITLLHLVTHTSGLPRLPHNFAEVTTEYPTNPYEHYHMTHLHDELVQYRSLADLPSFGTIRYSNFGMALLAHLLCEQLEMEYETAIQTYMCRALQMTNTVVTLSDEQERILAHPHNAFGLKTNLWGSSVMQGDGALVSTCADLLRFLQWHMRHTNTLPSSLLDQALHIYATDFYEEQTRVAQKLLKSITSWIQWVRSRPTRIALTGVGFGWFQAQLLDHNEAIWFHDGGTGGSSSFIGFNASLQCGVIILINMSQGLGTLMGLTPSLTRLGITLLSRLSQHCSSRGRQKT